MTDLSKQQLILLALLVSFVTSLATGIVTVSLMDQAPQGVTRTVTQVIERTIAQAMPDQTAAVAPAAAPTVADMTADAVSSVSLGTVQIRDRGSASVAGKGLVVSKDGVILADKSTLAALSGYDAVLSNGTVVPVAIIQTQIQGDIVFLAPQSKIAVEFSPILFGMPALGQSVFSLSGTSSPELGQGIVTRMPLISPSADPALVLIKTSIASSSIIPGSPLFNIKGEVIGIRTSSVPADNGVEFYPLNQLKSVIPVIK